MSYTKQDLIDIINEWPDDVVVAFVSETKFGTEEREMHEANIVQLAELNEEELLNLCLCMEDEEATHIVYLEKEKIQ